MLVAYACVLGVGCAHQMPWERYMPSTELLTSLNASAYVRDVVAQQVIMKDRLVYRQGEDTPFTGRVSAYYPGGGLANVLTMEGGKIIGAACKTPDGLNASSFSRGTGQIKTFHPTGQIKTITWIKNSDLIHSRIFNKSGECVRERNTNGGFDRLVPFFWEPGSI